MSDKVLLGENNDAELIRQPDRYGWNRTRGDYLIRTWRGTARACWDRARLARASGIEVEVEEAYGMFTVRETFGFEANPIADSEEPVPVYEFDGGEVEKDLLEVDLERNDPDGGLTPEEIRAIRSLLTLDVEDPANEQVAIDLAAKITSQAGTRILKLEQYGVRSKIKFAPVVRATITVSLGFDKGPIFENVGRVLRTPALFRLEAIPETLLAAWPGLADVDPPFGDDSVRPQVAYGWLKKFPKQNLSAWNRNQIVREFIYGLWSVYEYEQPVS